MQYSIEKIERALDEPWREISFHLENDEQFSNCWMGIARDAKDVWVYWFGLAPDGTMAFEYATRKELFDAKVFNGKSLREVWKDVVINDTVTPII